MDLDRRRFEEILANFAGQRILVVGDLMLDRFIFGEATRISPEAPVPVVHVRREEEMPGGSCNVGMNVRSLGGAAVLCGVIGDDLHGTVLHELLERAGIGCEGIVLEEGGVTIVKTRIIAQRQQVARVDYEDGGVFSEEIVGRICANVERLAAEADGIVIEDYGKGVVVQHVVQAAIDSARARDIPVGFDPKDSHELDVRGVTVATPNRKETFDAAGLRDRHLAVAPLENGDLLAAGQSLLERWGPELLMTTLGADGMLLQSAGAAPRHVPTRAREVFDVSGAGDTVVAATVLALAAGADHYEAAELANFAAGVVVGKLGTATTTPGELLDFMEWFEDGRE